MVNASERAAIENDFKSFLHQYELYSNTTDNSKLEKDFEYAFQAHIDQRRQTGEPYITHPLTVATILLELEVDQATLVAALLHDTVEDTGTTLEDIADRFGDDVAALVDGVTKLEKIRFSSKEELQAENFRKMFLAMAKDIRVVLIKLADRLHNMRTLKTMREDKQKRIAQETLDIYAPLAHRLGIYKWKWELEDLCLRYLDRTAYYELVGAIAQRREERERYLQEIIIDLQKTVAEMGINAEIEGRPKHFYSIYRKMEKKHKSLDQIFDLFACRVIVDTVVDCYTVLGLVHDRFRPIPGRFKDYIATPKPNMYQSLHTTVFGPKGVPFEIQIRTFEMHRVAEYGIAAHYRYKEGKTGPARPGSKESANDTKLAWLRQLLDWQKDMKDAGEFMEGLRNGLIEDEVFVFTPRGDVICLPIGATPIDFAYNIHSGIGNRMYGARINSRIAPIDTELKNGDIVEILTSDKVHGPSRDWLNVVRSSSARSKINQWFKKEMRDENVQQGKAIFERELKKTGFTSHQLMKHEFIDTMLQKNHFNALDDMFAAIGFGGFSATKAIPKLRDEYIRSLPPDERLKYGYRVNSNGQVVPDQVTATISEAQVTSNNKDVKHKRKLNDLGIIVKGMDNCLVHLSRCCNPVVGDAIIGYITRGKGVAVHRRICPNISKLLSNACLNSIEAERASRLIECSWSNDETAGTYTVNVKILARDRSHLLSDITCAIAEEKVEIVGGSLSAVKDVTATLFFSLEVKDAIQCDRVFGRIKAIRDVMEIHRI